jgi:hypothetical protein
MIEYYFTTLLLFAVICALLRQMNKERLEREDGALRYRELALRVRNVQLREEVVQESTQDWFDQQFGATVAEVEGADMYGEPDHGPR